MIGIIGAMMQEVENLLGVMEGVNIEEAAGLKVYRGSLEGQDVALVVSGVGKVNMAMCTQMLIDRYHVEALINTGVAGSLDASIDIGDIVIGKNAVHHDMDATLVGEVIGQIPDMPVLDFPCDERLIALAEECATVPVHVGRVATGDIFVADDAVKSKIIENFGASCCEMEGAAMAQVAYNNKVPCVILRAISDKADHSFYISYEDFKPIAIRNLGVLLRGMMQEW